MNFNFLKITGVVSENKKIGGEIKKLIFVVIGTLLLTSMAYACSGDECKKDSNIGDINDGNKGYIFTYYCEKGNESLGKWVDPTSIPELKGEKGDNGDTGQQGIQGEQGIQGIQGEQGIQGLKGDKGDIGLTGKDGLNGINGKDGINGIDGLNGDKGDKGEQGIQGFKGDKGDKGDNGKDVDPQTVIDLQNTDTQLNNSLLDEVTNRIFEDNNLLNLLGTETNNRTAGDTQLQKNINNLNDNAVLYDNNRDVTLENNLTVNGNTLINGNLDVKGLVDPDALLLVPQNTIPSEDIGTIYYDNGNVNSFMFKDASGWRNYGNELNNHEARLTDHENRINKLEETQYNVEGVLRILDTKKTTLEIYNTYDTRHSREVAVGVRVTYKLGKSYQDRVNEKTDTRLSNLEKTMGNAPIITKVIDTKGKMKSISINSNGLNVNGEF